jgi:hypothetical protein
MQTSGSTPTLAAWRVQSRRDEAAPDEKLSGPASVRDQCIARRGNRGTAVVRLNCKILPRNGNSKGKEETASTGFMRVVRGGGVPYTSLQPDCR